METATSLIQPTKRIPCRSATSGDPAFGVFSWPVRLHTPTAKGKRHQERGKCTPAMRSINAIEWLEQMMHADAFGFGVMEAMEMDAYEADV